MRPHREDPIAFGQCAQVVIFCVTLALRNRHESTQMLRPLGLALCLASPAAAFQPLTEVWCMDRADLVAKLTAQFQLVQVGQGMRDPESVMELWSGPKGDWTLVTSYANGRACVVSMGAAWVGTLPRDPA